MRPILFGPIKVKKEVHPSLDRMWAGKMGLDRRKREREKVPQKPPTSAIFEGREGEIPSALLPF